MKFVKILFAVALVGSFAACKPASCKKLKDCCTALTAAMPAMGASCGAIDNMNGDQCTATLNSFHAIPGAPAACN